MRLTTRGTHRAYPYNDPATGYHAMSEDWITVAVKLAKLFRDTVANANPITP